MKIYFCTTLNTLGLWVHRTPEPRSDGHPFPASPQVFRIFISLSPHNKNGRPELHFGRGGHKGYRVTLPHFRYRHGPIGCLAWRTSRALWRPVGRLADRVQERKNSQYQSKMNVWWASLDR